MTLLDPHLDLDQVSAAVDGEREPAVAAHLLVCLACRQQVDTWRATLGSLRDLPTAPDVDADVAVARAMATWTPVVADAPSLPASPVPEPAAGGSPSLPASRVPEPAAGGSPAGGPDRRRSAPTARPGTAPPGSARKGASRWLRLRPPPGVAAAAMIVVLLAGAVIGVSRLSHGQDDDKSSASATAAQPAAGFAAAPTSASGSPSFTQTAQLAAQLRRLAGPAGANTHATGAPGGASAGATSSAAPSAPCLRQVKRIALTQRIGGGDAPYFDETVRLEGIPSQVFAFAGAQGPVALVVRSRTCSLLATVQF
jgi:hypothetical protein